MSDTTKDAAWAPDRIWLQREQGEDGSHTWCEDSVGDGDLIEEVEYVRADRTKVQAEAVAWQVRRANGRIDGVPIQWENCTKELYEATLSTGRYAGFENGPRCEVRALIAAPAPSTGDRS